MRLFVSDVEDKAWFHDRSFWPAYLDMLARHRFNRFNLAFGIGYDFARQLRCPTPLFDATVPIYNKAMKTGHADHDTAAVCAVLEKMAQVKRRRR